MPELTVISWRDIPMQVTAGKGRHAARIQLSERFQDTDERLEGLVRASGEREPA